MKLILKGKDNGFTNWKIKPVIKPVTDRPMIILCMQFYGNKNTHIFDYHDVVDNIIKDIIF